MLRLEEVVHRGPSAGRERRSSIVITGDSVGTMIRGASAVGVTVVALVVLAAGVVWWQRSQGATSRGSIGPSTIVLLGDSLTEEGDWEALLSAWPVSNQGYSGFTSAQLITVAEAIAADRPRLVLVLAGTNDIRDGHPPAWTEANLVAILDRLERAGPETTIILQSLLPRADASAEVVATNERLTALAIERHLTVLDLYSDFDDGSGGLRAQETRDGLHLTEAGYQRWADLIEPVLELELGLD